MDLDWAVGNVTFSLVKAERTPKGGFNNDAGDVLGGVTLHLADLKVRTSTFAFNVISFILNLMDVVLKIMDFVRGTDGDV